VFLCRRALRHRDAVAGAGAHRRPPFLDCVPSSSRELPWLCSRGPQLTPGPDRVENRGRTFHPGQLRRGAAARRRVLSPAPLRAVARRCRLSVSLSAVQIAPSRRVNSKGYRSTDLLGVVFHKNPCFLKFAGRSSHHREAFTNRSFFLRFKP
jgi:hypothetical protein